MERAVHRRTLLAAAGTATLAGCLGGLQGDGDSGDPSGDRGGESTDRGARATERGGGSTEQGDSRTATRSRGPPTADRRLQLPMAPAEIRERAVSGGPPKDGIPSIDEPTFVTAEDADGSIDPGDPVFGVATGSTAKAYPQSILVWHEICNDAIDGTPVSVTYCPLTGTAMGFERGGTTFGVSGRLVNNNLIMYDRADETWWPQVLATAVPGPWNPDPPARSLREFRVVWTTWDRWRRAHPDTLVLSRDTGFAKNYDQDPYGSYNPRHGYYSVEAAPMFGTLNEDGRLPPKAVVIGARSRAGAAAFRKSRLRSEKLLDGELGGSPVLAAYDPSLDTGYAYRNPDGGTFEYRDGRVVDGDGEAHAPDALPLDRVLAFDAMWFAWTGFYPETTLYA